MSKSTLVSIVPFPIVEFKPGIYPGFFEIPPCKSEIPEILVISDSVYHVEIDENRTITVKCPSEDIAKSIVDDYIVSNLAYSVDEDAAPGFMYKSGEFDLPTVMIKFSGEINELKKRQLRWFGKLVEMADDDWERSRQHKFISDMQRHAAKALKLDRPWLIVPQPNTLTILKCPACQSIIPPEAIVCANCRCILNMEKYKTLQFAEK